MKRRLLLAWVVLLPVILFGNDAKLAPELKQQMSHGTASVIVQYKTAPGKPQLDQILRWGGKPGVKLVLINAVSVQLPQTAIAPLSDDDAVAYISPDRPVRSHSDGAAAPAVLADYAYSLGFDGSGVGVAVIDSGFYRGGLLRDSAGKSRVLFNLDLVGDLSDPSGHGALVAAIIGGKSTASDCPSCEEFVRGIAPNVSFIDLRALNNVGSGTDSAVIAAVQAAVQLKNKYNVRVLNLSLGRPVRESHTLDPLCRAVEQAWKAGIVVVVSAGNNGRDNSAGTNGYATIEAPGNDPYVITVGAINTKRTPSRADDVMTSFSSKGPTAIDHIVKPDLVAPGNEVPALRQSVLSDQPQVGISASSGSGNYPTLSGTSAAAAVVSGAASLLLQQDPSLTPDQVKARLMKTADKNLPSHTAVINGSATYTVQSDVFTVGAGYLNLQAALSDTDLAPGVAKSPTAYYNPGSGDACFRPDSTTPWGNPISQAGVSTAGSVEIWSATNVWGENVFLLNSASRGGNSMTISPDNAMWGGNAVTIGPDNAMWGGNAVTIDPDNAMWGGNAVTMGPDNAMWGGNAVTIGPDNAMWGGNAVTIGPDNAMWGGNAVTIGPDNAMWGGNAVTIGPDNAMWGGNAVTIGPDNAMWGGNAITIGPDNAMWGGNAITIGPGNAMWGGNAVTIRPDNAMWGGALPPASLALWGSSSATWGGTPSPVNLAIWGNSPLISSQLFTVRNSFTIPDALTDGGN